MSWTYNIADRFVPAVMNGDRSGLAEEDDAMLEFFLMRATHMGDRVGTWTLMPERPLMRRRYCDVSQASRPEDCRQVVFEPEHCPARADSVNADPLPDEATSMGGLVRILI